MGPLESGFQPATALELISLRLLMASMSLNSVETFLTHFKPLIMIIICNS